MTADPPGRRRRRPAAFARHVAAAHFDVMLARALRAATGEGEPRDRGAMSVEPVTRKDGSRRLEGPLAREWERTGADVRAQARRRCMGPRGSAPYAARSSRSPAAHGSRGAQRSGNGPQSGGLPSTRSCSPTPRATATPRSTAFTSRPGWTMCHWATSARHCCTHGKPRSSRVASVQEPFSIGADCGTTVARVPVIVAAPFQERITRGSRFGSLPRPLVRKGGPGRRWSEVTAPRMALCV
jgi:hypothetical protein